MIGAPTTPRAAQEQAAATRTQILASAQLLFERDGYAATSMAAVAADAGVSLKTVYVAFETKSGLLRAAGTACCAARVTASRSATSPGSAVLDEQTRAPSCG